MNLESQNQTLEKERRLICRSKNSNHSNIIDKAGLESIEQALTLLAPIF